MVSDYLKQLTGHFIGNTSTTSTGTTTSELSNSSTGTGNALHNWLQLQADWRQLYESQQQVPFYPPSTAYYPTSPVPPPPPVISLHVMVCSQLLQLLRVKRIEDIPNAVEGLISAVSFLSALTGAALAGEEEDDLVIVGEGFGPGGDES